MSAFPDTTRNYAVYDCRTHKYLRTMIVQSCFGKQGCDDTARIECAANEYPVPVEAGDP